MTKCDNTKDEKEKAKLQMYRIDTPPMGGEGYVFELLGTLGTLARFLGEFGHFSRVPKNAIGTLEMKKAEIKQKVAKAAKNGATS